jgi:hypothetical protein
MLDGLDVSLHPISVKTFPVQMWFDETSHFILLGELKCRLDAASGMPITRKSTTRSTAPPKR